MQNILSYTYKGRLYDVYQNDDFEKIYIFESGNFVHQINDFKNSLYYLCDFINDSIDELQDINKTWFRVILDEVYSHKFFDNLKNALLEYASI